MFKPWGPSAVPTGGAGVALPAGNCNLIVVCIFFGGIFLPQILLNFKLIAKLGRSMLRPYKKFA
jgi:hypothetical protein